MIADNVLDILKNILDILLVWFMFYYILKNIKNNVKMSLLFKGVLVIIILKLISGWIGLNTLGLVLEYIIMYGPLAIIIIFSIITKAIPLKSSVSFTLFLMCFKIK